MASPIQVVAAAEVVLENMHKIPVDALCQPHLKLNISGLEI